MAFPPELLTPGEELVLDLRPHWLQVFFPTGGLVLAIILGLLMVSWAQPGWLEWLDLASGLLIVAALIWFGISYARWATTNFVVTNERVISRVGVVAKKGIEIPLDRINTVFFNQRLIERLVGAGDLSIESAGESGKQTFHNIRKPHVVQQEIYRMMEEFENRRISRIGEAVSTSQPPSAAPAGASIPEQIEQLDRLRQQGSITEAEYEAKKADLLRRM